MPARHSMSASRLTARPLRLVLLAVHALVASGLPLPVMSPPAGSAAARKLAAKDRSQPFPCMDKACGCDSAERCFTNCCCHTPAETLAWAKARGIDAAVIDALMRRVAVAAPPSQDRGCCAAKSSVHEASCGSAGDDNPDNAICSDYQSLAADTSTVEGDAGLPDAPRDPSGDAGSTCRVVTLKAMLACGGVLAEWASIGISLPPPPIVQCDVACPQIGVIMSWNAGVLVIGGPPDLPPPRA
jgi:hypothetical protein